MAEAGENRYTRSFKKLQESNAEMFGLTYNRKGMVTFSAKGLDRTEQSILEDMIDERLEKGVFSLKKENEKKREWQTRANKSGFGYTNIPESQFNSELFFTSYEDERDFFNFLQDVMDLVDFYYDPEGSRDMIYNAYHENLSITETARILKNSFTQPEYVTPPKGGGKFKKW